MIKSKKLYQHAELCNLVSIWIVFQAFKHFLNCRRFMVKLSNLEIFCRGKILINHNKLDLFDGWDLIILNLWDGLLKHAVVKFYYTPDLGFELGQEPSVEPFSELYKKFLFHCCLEVLDRNFSVWLRAWEASLELVTLFSDLIKTVFQSFIIATPNF